MIDITPIPAFNDNYIWMIHSDDHNQVFVVDPGDSQPVEEVLTQKQLALAGILVTHHHYDHTGGVAELTKKRNIPVYGPDNPNISGITQPLSEGMTINVLGISFSIFATPGHTLDHIVYFTETPAAPILFCGDTLFAAGCGRLFEGTPEQMHESLAKLASLPKNTRVCCAHEYTLANLSFALAVEPENPQIQQQISKSTELRRKNLPTLPSSIGTELNTNPFMRCHQPDVISAANTISDEILTDSASILRVIRAWKDVF